MKLKEVISEMGSLLEGLAYATFLQHQLSSWGATTKEVQMTLPGDDIITEPKHNNTLAITIDAQPDAIWPWMVQMGQDRAGYYTHVVGELNALQHALRESNSARMATTSGR